MSTRTTDTARPGTRPARWKPAGGGVLTFAIATFLVILILLAMQMAGGEDPALGDGQRVAQAGIQRPVIHRRVIKARVVHEPPPAPASSGATVYLPSASVGTAAPAPLSSPVAIPAPAPAPAPAPVPAPPPVTSTS